MFGGWVHCCWVLFTWLQVPEFYQHVRIQQRTTANHLLSSVSFNAHMLRNCPSQTKLSFFFCYCILWASQWYLKNFPTIMDRYQTTQFQSSLQILPTVHSLLVSFLLWSLSSSSHLLSSVRQHLLANLPQAPVYLLKDTMCSVDLSRHKYVLYHYSLPSGTSIRPEYSYHWTWFLLMYQSLFSIQRF